MSPRSLISLALGLGLVALAALAGCAQHHEAGGGEKPLLKVSKVVVRKVTNTEEFTGRTEAVETVEIRARATGYLLEVNFKAGDEITKLDKDGKPTVLFKIDPDLYKAALEKAEGQVDFYNAKLTRARSDLQRNKPLVASGAISRQEYDRYVAELNEAQGGLVAAKAAVKTNKLNLGFTTVYAPIDGRIGRNLITVGNLVEQDKTHLATIVSEDPMYVYFDVPERTLLKARDMIAAGKFETARKKGKEKLPVRIERANETGFPHKGWVDFVNNQVDAGTGTIKLRGVFRNPLEHGARLLTPKLFVRVQVPIGDEHSAVLISDRAVGSDQGQKYVFVVGPGDVIERRVVTLGALHEVSPPGASTKGEKEKKREVRLREVLDGLKEGERIVVGGLQRVVPGTAVRVEEVAMPGVPAPNGAKP
jgi:RND family efflux transporter MFP subunit